jgi:hypothetical protein
LILNWTINYLAEHALLDLRHGMLVIGRREQMPIPPIVICTEAWPAKVITSLIEKPCSIQSDTAKCRQIFDLTAFAWLRG